MELTPVHIRGRRYKYTPHPFSSSTSSPSRKTQGRLVTPSSRQSTLSDRSMVSKRPTKRARATLVNDAKLPKTVPTLETMPTEIIQLIFSYCLGPNLPMASPILGRALSNSFIYESVVIQAWSNPSTHCALGRYRISSKDWGEVDCLEMRNVIANCRWFQRPLFERCARLYCQQVLKTTVLDSGLFLQDKDKKAIDTCLGKIGTLSKENCKVPLSKAAHKGTLRIKLKSGWPNISIRGADMPRQKFSFPYVGMLGAELRIPHHLFISPPSDEKLDKVDFLVEHLNFLIDFRQEEVFHNYVTNAIQAGSERALRLIFQVGGPGTNEKCSLRPDHYQCAVSSQSYAATTMLDMLLDHDPGSLPRDDRDIIRFAVLEKSKGNEIGTRILRLMERVS